MATAMPANTGTKGNHSSIRPMVEEAIPTMNMKMGMMATRALPLKTFSRPATRPLNAPLLMMMLMEA